MAENVREVPPPELLAAVICDMVIVDALTRKTTVVGIFDVINAPGYPAQHHSLSIFCQLTNGRGRVNVCIRVLDLENEEQVIAEPTMEAEFLDVRQIVSVVFRVGGLTFPHPGEYRVQVFAGTQFLGERRILCRLLSSKAGDNP